MSRALTGTRVVDLTNNQAGPSRGHHRSEILRELGLGDKDIDALARDGAI